MSAPTPPSGPDPRPQSPTATSLAFPVVGLGASAGGLKALIRFFENVPECSGMAFVVVLHLSPLHESNVPAILQRATPMPVIEVHERQPIEADKVYVIAPTQQLTMNDGLLEVTVAERKFGALATIDTFFRTLAQAHRERAMIVVMSGTGSDGTVGLARVKELGGLTVVQSPDDAEYNGMPQAAIDTGLVDFVLPVHEIPARLTELWRNAERIELPAEVSSDSPVAATMPQAPASAEAALQAIMDRVLAQTGHDFKHYKRATVLRRIERRLQVTGLPNLPQYRTHLETHPHEVGALLQDLLISVTHFFRDPEAFDALARELQASVYADASRTEPVRAWVAGCATGEEAYAVAMVLAERAAAARQPLPMQVFASDIDERALGVARTGRYPTSIATDVSPPRLARFFTLADGDYRVSRGLREAVLFAAHNLLRDAPFSRLDLLCCRNLLIYLDREIQLQVLETFHYALQPGGLLFLGSSESADAAAHLFTVVDKKLHLYRANAVARRVYRLPASPSGGMLPRLATPALAPADLAEQPELAQLHDRLVHELAPASVLIDAAGNILHLSQSAARYLRYAGGTPTHNLVAVIREDLRLALRTMLSLSRRRQQTVQSRRVALELDGRSVIVSMMALPRRDPAAGTPFTFVRFDEFDASLDRAASGGHEAAGSDPLLAELERELQSTRESLQGSIGQSQKSNEELRASNEELQAINEELRSATEELETSKEELQSLNEELITVNFELKDKVEETSKVNDDLSNLIASTDIATIFVDRRLRIKRYTPRATDLFNIIGSDLERSLLDITHKLDYPQLHDDLEAAFTSLQRVQREIEGPGDTRYLARALPYRTHDDRIDGAVLLFVDISATRRVEGTLRKREQHLRLMAENMLDYAFITLDPAGIVATWSKGAEKIFGYREDEIVGLPIDTLSTPEDRAAGKVQRQMRQAAELGRVDDERWHLRKDGSRFFCAGVMSALVDGTLQGFAKIARDLTDSKLAEAQREQLLETEKHLRAKLQEASVMKDEFLAVMSHELKHPLNLIHVNAELLTRMPEVRAVSSVTSAANVIRRTVVSQARMIDDLLDLSRIYTGKLSLSFVALEWVGLIERVVNAVQSDVLAKRLTLACELDPAASRIHADPLRVEQIVWNLVSNALKFTPEGGTIRISLSLDGRLSRLQVADNGRGIELPFLQHLFGMFQQANSGISRLEGGLGIGLALVKHLAEQQGGKVMAESDGPGQGARFSVWLPRTGAEASSVASEVEVPGLQGLEILLVDDTRETLESFGALLQLEGAVVTECDSAASALDVALGRDFDLILSDIGMPGMDGYRMMALLRQRERTRSTLAIALTGYGRAQDQSRALEAGFDGHLSKPVQLEGLLALVKQLRQRPA